MPGFVGIPDPPEPDAEPVGCLLAAKERGDHLELLETEVRSYVVSIFRFSSLEVKKVPDGADEDVAGGIKKGSSHRLRELPAVAQQIPNKGPFCPSFQGVFALNREEHSTPL
jgi:hypothetical protein